MVFNATFNNISAISWRSVLLVEETGGPGEDHPPAASHWQTYHIMLYRVDLMLDHPHVVMSSHSDTLSRLRVNQYPPCSLTRRVLLRNSKSQFYCNRESNPDVLTNSGSTHLPVLHQGGCNCNMYGIVFVSFIRKQFTIPWKCIFCFSLVSVWFCKFLVMLC